MRRLVTLALIFLCMGNVAAARERVAMIIGNAEYRAIAPLDNPGNDAADMSAALQELGFEVFGGQNLTRLQMIHEIDRFESVVAQSEVALFFFAGHAFQLGGQNYLLPVDLVPRDAEGVLDQSILLDDVMAALEAAPGLRLIILDSCRDNPLGVDAVAGRGGLAQVGSEANYMIAYATQPGAVAFDGEGRNGTFTSALLAHIHTPGQTLADLMIAVRKDVIAATGGQQIPWDSSSLTRQFQFDPRPQNASEETLLFQMGIRARSRDLLQLYLERFPRGSHVADVLAFLDESVMPELPERSLPEGEELWQLAKQSQLRPVAESYLALYPNGPHADAAARLASTLPDRADLGPEALCRELATHPNDAHGRFPGTDTDTLRRNVVAALSACTQAAEAHPEQPGFTALLARATFAAGRVLEAHDLYRAAAEAGDLRAMISLGLLTERGIVGDPNPRVALDYYRQAADGGSIDGMVNVAVELVNGSLIDKDVAGARALFERAADAGSAEATFNLGRLSLEADMFDAEAAYAYFIRAAELGELRGYRAAAKLLDRNFGNGADPDRAAGILLRGAVEDDGTILAAIETQQDTWSRETIAAMQDVLASAGFDVGVIDGIVGPKFLNALKQWRNGGYAPEVFAHALTEVGEQGG